MIISAVIRKRKSTPMIIKRRIHPVKVPGNHSQGHFVCFHRGSTSHYSRFRSEDSTSDLLRLSDPAVQSERGARLEIARPIMLLADSSLITALPSISNYPVCPAERGRKMDLVLEVFMSARRPPSCHAVPLRGGDGFFFAARSSAQFHSSRLIRSYFHSPDAKLNAINFH